MKTEMEKALAKLKINASLASYSLENLKRRAEATNAVFGRFAGSTKPLFGRNMRYDFILDRVSDSICEVEGGHVYAN